MSALLMAVQVKICGINTPEAARAVLAAGADYAGLVFFPRSPRAVDLATGAMLADILRGKTKIVALTVNADDALLAAIMQQVRPDFLQLHGGESPSRILEIKQRFSVPVIRAVSVAAVADLEAAAPVMKVLAPSDRLLFDAKPPKGSVLPGGNGIAFDGAMLECHCFPCPWLLAGGLSAANLAAAVKSAGAKAVDVSSGVESAPGVKDPGKIAAFVAAARSL